MRAGLIEDEKAEGLLPACGLGIARTSAHVAARCDLPRSAHQWLYCVGLPHSLILGWSEPRSSRCPVELRVAAALSPGESVSEGCRSSLLRTFSVACKPTPVSSSFLLSNLLLLGPLTRLTLGGLATIF